MIALLLAALLIGILKAFPLADLLATIQTGFGSTLGSLAILVVFGAVIRKSMVDSEAADQIADTLVERLGIKRVKVAMVLAGTLFGITMVVLFIGAGGALKEVIIGTGIGDYIGDLTTTSASPYIMAWLITALIRLATGQGVVSAMTSAGSNTLTHVNDASIWLFKGYFDLSVKETLKTWGFLQLCNSLVGLGIVTLTTLIVPGA